MVFPNGPVTLCSQHFVPTPASATEPAVNIVTWTFTVTGNSSWSAGLVSNDRLDSAHLTNIQVFAGNIGFANPGLSGQESSMRIAMHDKVVRVVLNAATKTLSCFIKSPGVDPNGDMGTAVKELSVPDSCFPARLAIFGYNTTQVKVLSNPDVISLDGSVGTAPAEAPKPAPQLRRIRCIPSRTSDALSLRDMLAENLEIAMHRAVISLLQYLDVLRHQPMPHDEAQVHVLHVISAFAGTLLAITETGTEACAALYPTLLAGVLLPRARLHHLLVNDAPDAVGAPFSAARIVARLADVTRMETTLLGALHVPSEVCSALLGDIRHGLFSSLVMPSDVVEFPYPGAILTAPVAAFARAVLEQLFMAHVAVVTAVTPAEAARAQRRVRLDPALASARTQLR